MKITFQTAFILALLFAAGLPSSTVAQSTLLREIESSYVQLYEQAAPCVVSIETRGPVSDIQSQLDLFYRYFGEPDPEGKPEEGAPHRPRGQGSGMIYDKQGRIVTNNHVIEGAEKIVVTLPSGKELVAQIVGADPETDLAVLKVDSEEELPVARLGDSSTLKVGQFAMAVGNSRGFSGSASFGHISALGREGLYGLAVQGLTFQNLIQTDAAINLGNSGGPLFNIEGEVIGINTAILWGANSIAFAVPVNTVKRVVPELIERGKVTRGYMGVAIDDAAAFAEALELPEAAGAIVKRVQEDTPAERAGIRTYDVILKINGDAVRDANDLVSKVSSYAPGTAVKVTVWRDKRAMELEVSLDERNLAAVQPEREQDVLGMRLRALPPQLIERMGLAPDLKGVLIAEVKPDTPAEDAKLLSGDIILEVAQTPVASPAELIDIIKRQGESGKTLLIRYMRAGNEPDLTVIRVP